MFHLMDDYYFPSQLFFSDPQHGWILGHWSMMNSTHDALLVTTDGGRTWKRLADAPGAGPLQFISARDGWVAGGPEDWDGVGRPEDTQLWVAHDGGAAWKSVPVPVPRDSSEQEPYLSAFKFKSMDEGTAIVEEQLGPRLFRVFTCRTREAAGLGAFPILMPTMRRHFLAATTFSGKLEIALSLTGAGE
jgi:hypothetical protein